MKRFWGIVAIILASVAIGFGSGYRIAKDTRIKAAPLGNGSAAAAAQQSGFIIGGRVKKIDSTSFRIESVAQDIQISTTTKFMGQTVSSTFAFANLKLDDVVMVTLKDSFDPAKPLFASKVEYQGHATTSLPPPLGDHAAVPVPKTSSLNDPAKTPPPVIKNTPIVDPKIVP